MLLGELFAALLGRMNAQALLGNLSIGRLMSRRRYADVMFANRDLLLHRRHQLGSLSDRLLPTLDLRPQCPQFTPTRDQPAGSLTLADEQRAVGAEEIADERDKIRSSAALFR